jgi:hypothetical protein
MNCQKFENVASELARNQIMDVELREALVHSESCTDCAARLREQEMLTRGLRSLASQMNSFEAPAALQNNLMSAFRQEQVVVPMPVRKDYRRYWLAAVAALILIVFSVIAVRMQHESVPAPQQAVVEHPLEVAPKQGPESPQFAVEQTPTPDGPVNVQPHRSQRSTMKPLLAQAKNNVGRSKSNNVVSNHASSEVATDFMPIGYLNMESVQDGAQIVRVEVPRTALVKFGIAVNMDRPNERVKADVLLGVDGMAHAIRFVQDRKLQ